MYPFLSENGYFFLKFDLLFTSIRRKASFQKRSPKWGFLKTPAFRLRVHGRKKTEVFEDDDVIHHILLLAKLLA